MDLSDIGTLAEIFSASAILITLVYGAFQIRSSNRLARVQLTQQMGMGLHEFYRDLSSNSEKARIWREGLLDTGTLSPDERTQFTLLATAAFVGYEMQYRLSAEAMVPREFFERGARQIRYMMTQPGIRKWWPKNRLNFNQDFVAWIDQMLAEPDPAPAAAPEAQTA